MASRQIFTCVFIFSLVSFSYAAFVKPNPTAFHFPIRKNETSNRYYISFESGNPLQNVIDALIDVGEQSVWFDCTSYVSSAFTRVSCDSDTCKNTPGSLCSECTPGFSFKQGCSNNTCAVYAFNNFRLYFTDQELRQDTIQVTSTDGRFITLSYNVSKFQFSCSYSSDITEGFPGDHTKGLAGFARANLSFPSQIASSYNLAKKFALCLPSSSANGFGDVFIGGGPYFMPPSTEDYSKSLVTTPLLVNPVSTAIYYSEAPSDEYFINVTDIEISGKRVGFSKSLLSFDKNGIGGTKISTLVPYTILHATIYKRLVKDFVKEAALYKMKRVKNVEPFGACFNSKKFPKTITGPAVPNIDLVLEGKTARMRLYGSNSMVEAKKNVMCLAFIDGGAEPRTSIVLGGHQLENYLLEFDLAKSTLGLSSSLLVWNTSCSHSRLF